MNAEDLLRLREDSSGDAVVWLETYLNRFGYLRRPPDGVVRMDTLEAVKRFRRFMGLGPEGWLDSECVELLLRRRCALADIDPPGSDLPAPWPKRDLTCRVSAWSPLSEDEVAGEAGEAAATWSRVRVLSVTMAKASPSDLEIAVASIDGKGGVFGQAWYPNDTQHPGRIELDEDEPWSVTSNAPRANIDLQSVILHEMGHALGLSHLEGGGKVMSPTYSGEKRDLSDEDKDALKTLYP